jgi:hypothetical protein
MSTYTDTALIDELRARAAMAGADRTSLPRDRFEALVQGYADLMQQAADRLEAAGQEASSRRWRHKKRGSTYAEIGEGRIQTSEPLTDHAEVVIYRSEDDGELWVRTKSEFHDGRFEPVAPAGDKA